MEKRRILISDVQKTIQAAQKSGHKLKNFETGRELISHRAAIVTYWVEYELREKEEYMVYRTWSHRMEIKGVKK